MIFTNAKYAAKNEVNYGVHVTIDGVVSFVPINEQNTDYIELKKQLDEGSLTIESADTQTWDSIRATRNKILRDTDWTMTTGASVDQAQWAAYRQVIRDIPQTYKDKTPDDVVWPTQPSTKGPNS